MTPRAGSQPGTPEDYLAQVRRQLKGFPAEAQAAILDEIASHIESGQADPGVGEARVMAELGAPEQLGRELRGIHRPSRLVDLLLALGPYFLLSPLVALVVGYFYGPMVEWSPSSPYLYLGGRISVLLAILLALVARQRRSAPLTLFWLSTGLATLVSVMTRETRFLPGLARIPGSLVESLLLYAVLLALFAWLAWVLKQQLFDGLLVVFALLPLLLAAANYSTGQVLLRGDIPHPPGLALPFGLLGILAHQAAWAVGMALFFLFPQRDARWLGLLLMDLYSVYPNLSAYRASPAILLIWSAFAALVLLAWGWDLGRRGRAPSVPVNW